MKKLVVAASLATMMIMTGVAFGKTYYHVYQKNKTTNCEITTRTPDQFRKARGSSWKFLGKDTTRSGAKKKFFAKNGCK